MPSITNFREYVPNPHAGAPLRYGLFKVSEPIDLPIHAQIGGIEYETADCGVAHPYTVTCAPGASKTFDGGLTDITGDPFVVYTSSTCGTVGETSDRVQGIVAERLRVGEQAAVENVFSQQLNGQAPGLANNASAATLTAATTLTAAIGSLEGWLYGTQQYGLKGVIHVPALAATYFRENNSMLPDDEGVFRTPIGTAISMGNYSGLEPNGSAPAAGHTTVYITGMVAVYRDPAANVFVSPYGETVAKATNQYLAVAERSYIVTFDCFVAGIDITLAP
jgi:hypothetical protein